jgi:hypothetical protein
MFDHYHQIWDPYRKAWDNAVEEAILYTNHSVNHMQWRAPCPSRPVELDGWESMVAEAGFYNRFPEGERKEFTFITDFYKSTGEHLHYTELVSRHPFYRKWYADDLTPGWEWETRDEPTSKWRSGMELRMSWNCGRQVYILRYPDILLTYAEAKARTDGPDDLAYKCLNDVRNRAFKGVGSAEASLSGLSTAAFIDSVVWERAYEFCGFEFSARWFDLQRLELVEKANTEWRQETEEKYILRKPYTKKDYFLAIPNKEVQLNPNLANNNSEF